MAGEQHALLPAEALRGVLAEKVLHAWLQNRQQVLFPLTVNFRALAPEQAGLLMEFAALAVQLGATVGEAEVAAWLAGAGAETEALALFQEAVAAPRPPGVVLGELAAAGLGAYAYAVALGVLDRADPAGGPFLDFVAARLGVPPSVVRSVRRRSRR